MGNHGVDCDVCGEDLRGLGGGHATGCPENNPANYGKSLHEKQAMYMARHSGGDTVSVPEHLTHLRTPPSVGDCERSRISDRTFEKMMRYNEMYSTGPMPMREALEDRDKRLDNLEEAIAAMPTAISSLQMKVMNGNNAYNSLCRNRENMQASPFNGFGDILIETLMDGYEAQALLIKKLTDRVEFYKAGPKPEMSRQEMEDRLREWGHRQTWRDCLSRLIRK